MGCISKKCSRCKIVKNFSDFHVSNKSKDGLSCMCKTCFVDYIEDRYQRSLIRIKKIRIKKSTKDSHLKSMYDIDLKEYNRLYDLQEGKCYICNTHQKELSRSLCVDHNHETGDIRGLLCTNCNAGIGLLKDDINILENALKYLQKQNGN